MASCLCVTFFLLTLQTCIIFGDGVKKSSLTFVIDDTASMWNEIDQVKDEANAIFETVLSSNASQIENFILVTFNDPYAELRTVTKDRDEFKRALAAIYVHGGDDCPEYAMSGIEIALKESLPLSYLYVFTDASAKDHNKFELIKSLSQKQQSQVIFILTGECGFESDEDYQVYHKVAEATSGQVFNMMKNDVKDILTYVKETIKNRGEVLVSKKLPPGYGKKITYPVDPDTGDVLISITGDKPKIGEVTGPEGSKPKTDPLVEKDKIAIVKVTGARPGEHEVEVGSKSETHAVITAKTSIHFQLGFSTFKPTSISETATRPAPDGNSFLSIKLDGEGVKFDTAKLSDINGNLITELPLELVDDKEKFYVSPSFSPPTTMFRVSVSGYDENTKTPITRTSPTPIERQNPTIEKTENIAPQVTIEREPKIITDYDGPLQLKCKVHGYPKPDITWEDKETGKNLPATVSIIEIPYDFISIANIEKANKNSTYACKASNSHGINTKYIEVETKRKIYFDIIETPKDINIEYDKQGILVCKVEAYPPHTVAWYKTAKLVSNSTNIEISNDMTVLTIKHMQPNLSGKYICEVRNDVKRKVFYSNVGIFGLEKPLINREKEEIRVRKGRNAELSCRVVQGTPKPTIRWAFQREGTDKFTEIRETSEIIHFKNIDTDQAGSYECTANNIVGSDRFTMALLVEYPPKIKDDLKMLRVKDGEEVIITCDVDGEPTPAVKWFINGTKVENTRRTHISGDNTLKLRATVVDTGYYICQAENEFGVANKTIFVDIIIPVNIEIPKESTIETMVGKNVILPCRADGYPKPEIKWTFHSADPKIPSNDITPTDGSMTVILRRVQLNQEGYYTCVASNRVGESASITYAVKVCAPPVIENVYADKTFEVVEYDLVLRIQCKATGSPKPTISWKKDNLNIAFGSEWYDMEEDGTMIIKNIDRESQGTYVCLAQNILGNDTEMYRVVVNDYPKPGRPSSTIFIEEGKTVDVKCDIPHKNTDLLRWYKDGKIIAREELRLYDVTQADDGLYTCRVSDFSRSRSGHIKVNIGFKPRFVSDEEENIDFLYESLVLLICEAVGEPMPKVSWKHNGKEIPTLSETTYPLEMTYGNRGIYDCEVKNDFGSIHRSFNITSRDCILDIKKDFPEKQPLMLSPSLTWPTFGVTEGYMIIPNADYFFLNCPSGFSNLPLTKNAMAFCQGETKVKINGKTYNFAEIKCHEEVLPEAKKTGTVCLPGNTEYIQIGYKVYSEFVKVYDVCLDKDSNVTLFTKHKLSLDHTDKLIESKWVKSDLLPLDFSVLYDCHNQVDDITSSLGRDLTSRYSCCFARRQLVNSRNLRPGIPPIASSTYLNVVPHWSTCDSKNWDDVENRVRNLVKLAGRDLIITTGTASKPSPANISLRDGRGGSQPVAQYLWKVVQDPPSSASLAIIQVNIPDLSPSEAFKRVLCRDICGLVDWMKSSNWNNVKNGFTYCCTITDFEIAFGYKRRFSPGMNKILFDASLIPGYYFAK